MKVMYIKGHGVVTRHSRRCRNPREHDCPCEPGYEAWVYDRRRHKKKRKGFRTLAEARAWRLTQLRSLYAETPRRPGRTDVAYGLLRRSMQELDAAQKDLPPSARAHIRAALSAMYQAEDALLSAGVESLVESGS